MSEPIKTDYRCPICREKGHWRTGGYYFEGEKRCPACKVCWEPGEWVEIIEGNTCKWLKRTVPPNELIYEI